MKLLLTFLIAAFGCSGGNKPKKAKVETVDLLKERQKLYCELSEKIYIQFEGTVDPKCDAALFTGLHGLTCNYVTFDQFESEDEPGKLCRRPGCTCWDNREDGRPQSDSGFSKDMATGAQTYLAKYPDPDFVQRIVQYGEDNNWVVCDGETTADVLTKCTMTPKIINRWFKLAKKQGVTLEITIPEDYEAHLQIVGIINEYLLYDAVSDSSLRKIRAQAKREPNNLLFQAMAARFIGKPKPEEVEKRLLEFFPEDRLPTNKDYCTPYLYQRDEFRGEKKNKDWLPCKKKQVHAGTDFLLASWVLLDL